MGGLIPLGDVSRRLRRWPLVTVVLIAANVWVFFLELTYGDQFVYMYSVIPARIMAGRGWGTILTGDVSARQLAAHYREHGVLLGVRAGDGRRDGAVPVSQLLPHRWGGGDDGAGAGSAGLESAQPGSERSDCGGYGRVPGHLSAGPHLTVLFFLFLVRISFVPAVLLIGVWFLLQLFVRAR